jgi:hypothetical protein
MEASQLDDKLKLENQDLGELIQSLRKIGKAITKIQKQLGIEEIPLPLLDEGEFQNE